MDENIWNQARTLESGKPLEPAAEQTKLKAEQWEAFLASLSDEQNATIRAVMRPRETAWDGDCPPGWAFLFSLSAEQLMQMIASIGLEGFQVICAAGSQNCDFRRRQMGQGWGNNRCQAIRQEIARGNGKPREIVKALAAEGITVSKALIARVKARGIIPPRTPRKRTKRKEPSGEQLPQIVGLKAILERLQAKIATMQG